ncbi:MAG: choloylglycine hydrolase [Anaerotignum sp.]|nr:choloylglycine hydrolase [Anaerotignum sp.]
MCTAVWFQNRYFGRNLDYDRSFGEQVVITPRNFIFPRGNATGHLYGMIGMAHVAEGYPLYYDAMNEKGLAMAGLLFDGDAVYHSPVKGKENIPSWALIPRVLGRCSSGEEALLLLQRVCITSEPFGENLPPSPLHWMIADRERALVVESTKEGIQIYENPAGVLTNNPPFPFHRENLRQYLNLTAEEPLNRFSKALELRAFSRGMGAMGLPGDVSSPSRFVWAAFLKSNALPGRTEGENISQFFHILGGVEQIEGCVRLEDGRMEKTIYSSCCDLEEGRYFYRTYEEPTLQSRSFGEIDLNGSELSAKPLKQKSV